MNIQLKRNLINYKSTKYEFKILKKKISQKDNKLKNNNSKTVIEKTVITFFSIFNLIPLILISSALKKFSDRVFHLSIKYCAGFFIFPLWWAIVFFYFSLFFKPLLKHRDCVPFSLIFIFKTVFNYQI